MFFIVFCIASLSLVRSTINKSLLIICFQAPKYHISTYVILFRKLIKWTISHLPSTEPSTGHRDPTPPTLPSKGTKAIINSPNSPTPILPPSPPPMQIPNCQHKVPYPICRCLGRRRTSCWLTTWYICWGTNRKAWWYFGRRWIRRRKGWRRTLECWRRKWSTS